VSKCGDYEKMTLDVFLIGNCGRLQRFASSTSEEAAVWSKIKTSPKKGIYP
jgi:hypothetical protein